MKSKNSRSGLPRLSFQAIVGSLSYDTPQPRYEARYQSRYYVSHTLVSWTRAGKIYSLS